METVENSFLAQITDICLCLAVFVRLHYLRTHDLYSNFEIKSQFREEGKNMSMIRPTLCGSVLLEDRSVKLGIILNYL
jgi:hypothetical protein